MAYNNEAFDRVVRGAILRVLQPQLVTDAIVNRDLVRGSFEEPDDTVTVVANGELQVNDYNGTFGSLQELTGESRQITADHRKSFRFKVGSGDTAAQVATAISQQQGIAKLLRAAQKYVLAMADDAGLSLSSNFSRGSDDINDAVTEVAIELDEADVPENGRWLVLPPTEFHAIKDDLETRDTALGDNVIRGPGFGGVYKGFSVFRTSEKNFYAPSNLVHGMAGYTGSIAYQDALLNIRRNPSTEFSGDQVDGLHVGGGRVVRPGATLDFKIDTA
jgi:hypothetical protein